MTHRPALIAIWIYCIATFANPESAPAARPPETSSLEAGAAAVTITPANPDGTLWQEPYEDLNGNGRYDAPDPLNPSAPHDPYIDTNGNGKWDGPFLAGFHHNEVYYTATGFHDHLWARALVLQVGETRVGLLALDLVGLFYPQVEEIRQRVRDLNLTYLIVASTHTHGGTDSLGLWGPNRLTDGKDPRFMEHIQRQSERALRKAARKMTPARVKFSSATPPASFGWLVNDLRDPIVIDDRVLVMAVDNLQGQSIATVINWTPHPETLGGSSRLVTSDFPHYLREGVEKGGFRVGGRRWTGRGGVAIYFSGAVGGLLSTLRVQVSDEQGRSIPLRSWALSQRIGEIAASTALAALHGQEYTVIDRIGVNSRQLFIPIENAFFKILVARGVIQREAYTQGVATGPRGEDALTEVGILTLSGPGGTEAQFVAIPGELFPEIAIGGHLGDEEKCWRYTQRKRRLGGWARERIAAAHPEVPPEPILRQHMQARYKFIIGLANDELGYIVPANDFVPPVYEPRLRYGTDRCGDHDHYEESMSLGPKLAPLITRAVINLLEHHYVP